jgi:hypothetical protein
VADHPLNVKDMKPVVDHMAAEEHVGPVALVNKYD